MVSGAVAGAAAAGGAVARALAAMGPVVLVGLREFVRLSSLEREPLLVEVVVKRGIFRKREFYVYVTSVRGLVFITKSEREIRYRDVIKIKGEKLILPPALSLKLKELEKC